MKFYHELDQLDDPLRENTHMHIIHKFKYRIMCELRHLEKEIEEEGAF